MDNNSPFVKIQPTEPLSHRVENQIREAIKNKIFKPGDKLPGEVELGEQFGVSRTAIREALRMLVGRGLINIRKGSGIYVSEIDPSNVVEPFYQLLDMKCGKAGLLHLIRIRLFMEPEIAKSAALHRTEEDLDYLKENFIKFKDSENNPDEMVDIDIQFHRRISEATNNPIIPIIMEPIFQLLPKFISSNYKQSHAPDLAVKNHNMLIEFIEKKDDANAFKIMRKHMEEAEQHVLQHYEQIGFDIPSIDNGK